MFKEFNPHFNVKPIRLHTYDSLFWKDENIKNEWKEQNLKMIISRMQGWQLETFKESYNHKIKSGISLFKKKILEKK